MHLFFDTSAVVPLLLKEPGSKAARDAYLAGDAFYAWSWMRVETEAALIRRRADAVTWRDWRSLQRSFTWLGFPESMTVEVCSFNRELGLRAADAGHLFVLEKAAAVVPEIQLVTFDKEMTSAAKSLELAQFSI